MTKPDPNLDFTPAHVDFFMGGEFKLDQPETLGQLRKQLRAIMKEIDGWGDDDTEVNEAIFWQNEFRVGLSQGLVQ